MEPIDGADDGDATDTDQRENHPLGLPRSQLTPLAQPDEAPHQELSVRPLARSPQPRLDGPLARSAQARARVSDRRQTTARAQASL